MEEQKEALQEETAGEAEPEAVKKKTGKKKALILAAILIILILAAVLVFFFLHHKSTENHGGGADSSGGGFGALPGGMQISENTVTASGTVSVGIVEEEFEPDYIETELEIEEVYLSSNMEVKTGEKIAKLTQESVEKARDELTDACTAADLAYRAGVITYEQSVIEAQYEYDSNLLNGAQAQEVYEETLTQLQKAIDDAQKDIDDANEDIAEYTDAVENDAYDEEYQVSYLYAKYEADYKLLKDKMDSWDLPWQYVTGQDENGDPVMVPGNVPNASTAQALYKELDEEYKEYQEAKEKYDTAMSTAAYELQELQLEMTSLQAALQNAQNSYDEGVISAKAAYDTSVTKQKNAQSIYDTAIKKAQETLDSLQDDKDDAEENLAEFEERAGDGYLYTTGSGDILMVTIEEGSILAGGSLLLAYSDPAELTVMVSVSQDAINKISVGEEAYVTVSDYGAFQGKVQSINPVSQSSSRSSITYLVTVELEGDVSMLSANLSAQVIFGSEGGADENEAE